MKKILRGIKPKEGNYINIVIVVIENSKGKYLIQKTSKEKGMIWATTGGHVKSGQTCDEAIIEEIKEELGIDVTINELKHIQLNKFDVVFQDVYYLKKDIDIKKIILQKEEVECVKWLSKSQIKKLINKNKFRKSNIKAFDYIIGE